MHGSFDFPVQGANAACVMTRCYTIGAGGKSWQRLMLWCGQAAALQSELGGLTHISPVL